MTDNKKLFILDTNVLIVDPACIFKFEQNDVAIPLTVLEELDNIKSGDRTISRDARVAVRNIAGLVADGDFRAGVQIPDGGILSVLTEGVENNLDKTVNDNLIINATLYAQKIYNDSYEEIILVTNDINMRVKSSAAGVVYVQPYQSDHVVDDTRFLNKGWVVVEEGWLSDIPVEEIESKSCGGVIVPLKYFPEEVTLDTAINTWLFDDNDFVAMIEEVYEHQEDPYESKLGIVVKSRKAMMKRKAAGISPRSIQQAIAMDAILDRELDVVIMFAPAGAGKTLIAAAGATEMCVGKKKGYKYNEILFSKTADSQFKEEGFLPGSSHEKLQPLAGALYDNMEVICRESKRKELHPIAAINPDEGFIKLQSLNHMRGRSLNNRILLLDECFEDGSEILTEAGFKDFKQLQPTDKVAQYTDKGAIEFVTPSRIITKHYEGVMHKIESDHFYSCVTSNHRRVFCNKDNVLEVRIANEGFPQSNHFIPRTGILNNTKGGGIDNNWMKLTIALQADGNANHKNGAYYWQASFKKEFKIKAFQEIIDALGLEYTKYEPCSKGKVRFYIGRLDNTPVGDMLLLPSKTFNVKYLLNNLDQDSVLLFQQELLQWDGHITEKVRCYCTTNKDNAEFAQVLGHLSNHITNITTTVDNRKESYKDYYRVYFSKRNKTSLQGKKDVLVDYSGVVHCVTVPSGMVIVRQKGYVQISGNCQNMNTSQLKTLLSRAGSDCKVILMGNLAQIDNEYLSANNSGLTAICEIFSKWERAAIVHLESIERSALAEFVENNF